MRLYLIVNRYSLGIQAGIQALHVVPKLYEKLRSPKWDPEYSKNLSDWACNHETVMVLRTFGGHDSIEELYPAIAAPARELKMPFAIFREAALRNSSTAVGVVVPTAYYSHPVEELSEPLQKLHAALDQFPFAH